jgi:hypothetical protein
LIFVALRSCDDSDRTSYDKISLLHSKFFFKLLLYVSLVTNLFLHCRCWSNTSWHGIFSPALHQYSLQSCAHSTQPFTISTHQAYPSDVSSHTWLCFLRLIPFIIPSFEESLQNVFAWCPNNYCIFDANL